MTLHKLYDVLGDGCICLVRRVPNEGDCVIYTGLVDNFPYHLMRDYGEYDVLTVEGHGIYLKNQTTAWHGIKIVIGRDEDDYWRIINGRN